MKDTSLKDEIIKFVEKNFNNRSTRLTIDVNVPYKKVNVKRIVEEKGEEL